MTQQKFQSAKLHLIQDGYKEWTLKVLLTKGKGIKFKAVDEFIQNAEQYGLKPKNLHGKTVDILLDESKNISKIVKGNHILYNLKQNDMTSQAPEKSEENQLPEPNKKPENSQSNPSLSINSDNILQGRLAVDSRQGKFPFSIQTSQKKYKFSEQSIESIEHHGKQVLFRIENKQCVYLALAEYPDIIILEHSEEVSEEVKQQDIQTTKIQYTQHTSHQNKYSSQQPSKPPSKEAQHLNSQHSNNINSQLQAHAPYNFVPLNEKVVSLQALSFGKENKAMVSLDNFHQDRLTGYIELNITTKTPVYIRRLLTSKDLKENQENKDKPDFFQVNKKAAIPGSSLRGLIREMVEIASFGKFEHFDDKRLYFRAMADNCHRLRDAYKEKMAPEVGQGKQKRSQYQMRAGILTKKGFNYFITPVEWNPKEDRILIKDSQNILRKKLRLPRKNHSIYIFKDDFLIVSGHMPGNPGKEHDWWVPIPHSHENKFPISEQDVQDYQEDLTRSKDCINLLEKTNEEDFKSTGVPCFYTEWTDANGEKHIAFGHTPMFRLAYEKSIGEHVPENLKDAETIDFAEAIFGRSDRRGRAALVGRVSFEDAYSTSNSQDIFETASYAKILSSPKPTSFQLYLTQTEQNVKEHPRQLAHYNDETAIRGYKQYWHHNNPNWKETEENAQKHLTQYTKIKPVKTGQHFKGKIHFENLTPEELGALLFALDLPNGCYHKIGMGKPLGLGSIHIQPTLHLSNRTNRYTSFIAEWGELSQSPISAYKKAFEDCVLSELSESKKDLWQVDRLQELKVMLEFKNRSPVNDSISYMSLQSSKYKNRHALPVPTKVNL